MTQVAPLLNIRGIIAHDLGLATILRCHSEVAREKYVIATASASKQFPQDLLDVTVAISRVPVCTSTFSSNANIYIFLRPNNVSRDLVLNDDNFQIPVSFR